MKFEVLSTLIQDRIDSYWADKNVFYHPGPDDPDQPVDYVVVLSIDGGLGLQLEGAMDNISWQVRVIGGQNLYDPTERLAWDIDTALLSTPPGHYSDLRLLTPYRVGGPPQHLSYDSAERTTFVCSYFFDVESGLPPI